MHPSTLFVNLSCCIQTELGALTAPKDLNSLGMASVGPLEVEQPVTTVKCILEGFCGAKGFEGEIGDES